MADRRMFSKRIINSARFLTMPPSTQALYFHLGLNADDDGVVEGFMVMRQVGATQDDLRILVAKGFITLLNDDLVAYIMDWRENNKIRADRKTDSIYKELLLQVLPNVDLLPPKQRADTKKLSNGRPDGNQLPTIGQHRIRQDSLGQNRLGKDSVEQEPPIVPQEKDEVVVVNNPFTFWEKNMGLMTEYISQYIQMLTKDYGELTVLEGMQAALKQGKRNIAYVEGCCKNIHSGNNKPEKKELLF